MSVEKITKEVFRCHCEAEHKDNSVCDYQWDVAKLPLPYRCPKCKSRRWNRKRRISKKLVLSFRGETLSITDWATKLGLDKRNIYWRIRQGWPIEQILSTDDWRTNKAGGSSEEIHSNNS